MSFHEIWDIHSHLTQNCYCLTLSFCIFMLLTKRESLLDDEVSQTRKLSVLSSIHTNTSNLSKCWLWKWTRECKIAEEAWMCERWTVEELEAGPSVWVTFVAEAVHVNCMNRWSITVSLSSRPDVSIPWVERKKPRTHTPVSYEQRSTLLSKTEILQ